MRCFCSPSQLLVVQVTSNKELAMAHDTGYGTGTTKDTYLKQRTQQTAPSGAVVIEQVDLCTI